MCLNPLLSFDDDSYNLCFKVYHWFNIKKFTKLEDIKTNQLDFINQLIKKQKVKVFGCRQCFTCISSIKFDWYKRCQNERITNKWQFIYFITLTFDNKHYYRHNEKRLLSIWIRNNLKKLLGQNNFKYFAVGEYGSKTKRYHYHMLLFTNDTFDLIEFKKSKRNNTLYINDWFQKHWNYGFHSINLVDSPAAFKYCVKYTNKAQQLRVFCSRGLGDVINDFEAVNVNEVPKSVLKNAYVRNWTAIKKYKLKKIDTNTLNNILRINENYLILRNRINKLNFNNNYIYDKYYSLNNLNAEYNTNHLRIINIKQEL